MLTSKVMELPEDLVEIMEVDEDNLTHEFAVFTAIYARWLYARAHHQGRLLRAKQKLETKSAEARFQYREVEPKITVDDMKARIALDPEVSRVARDVAILEAQDDEIKAVIEALRAKKDMLISLGAQQRALLGPLGRSNDGIDLSE